MNTALLIGVGFGAGSDAVDRGLVPQSIHHSTIAIDRLHRPGRTQGERRAADTLLIRVVGRPLAQFESVPRGRAPCRCETCASPARAARNSSRAKALLCDRHGLALGAGDGCDHGTGGVSVSLMLPLWCSLAFATVGFFVPLLGLRSGG